MKKRFFTVISAFFLTFTSSAQTTDLGLPQVIKGKHAKTKTFEAFPAVDADKQILADEQNRLITMDKTFRFGIEYATSTDILQKAEKKTLPNGDVLYQYGIACPGAVSINVIFDQFQLAPGARLYLVANNGETFAGAYTSINNNAHNVLGTELVYDEIAIIEFVEPKSEVGKSILHLGTVVYGYREVDSFVEKAIGQAGNCNIDVNCPLGSGWESQRNATACVVSGGGICSGSLVNNTSGNIIPYYLSANHCGTAGAASWVFRFRWERAAANAICAATNSTANNGPTTMQINGGTLRASNSSSDFLLVELNSAPNPSWGIYYNGWDRSDALTVTQATGIHHPNGDIKKISRENDPLTQQVTPFNGNQNTNVWRVNNWDQGVTEPGSSGSPLFDQNHRTIGVLSGGSSACSGFGDNEGYDIYGRFGTAWDLGTTPATRLKEWLDPQNTGATFIDGVDPAGPTLEIDGGIQNILGLTENICGAVVSPQITIFNAGTSPLTNVEISYGYDGNNTLSYNWTGNLAQYGNQVITLPSQTMTSGSHTFSATITSSNGAADLGTMNNTISSNFSNVVNGEIVDLNLNLDYWASEISWELLNSNNQVIYSGGGYSNGTFGSVTPINVEFCLAVGCYNFKIMDTEGDGLTSNSNPAGSYTITSNNGTVLAEMTTANANFGSSNTTPFCVTSTIGIDEYLLNQSVSIYPNPAVDELNISVAGNATLETASIYNLTGQLILEHALANQQTTIQTANLRSGMYIVKIQTNQGLVIKQIAIR